MMVFRTIKSNLLTILGTAQASRYITIGYQGQTLSSKLLEDELRHVMVRYQQGDFPKAISSNTSTVMHEASYSIILQVAKNVKVDKAVLESSTSTDEQRAAALASADLASEFAEDSLDELIDIVYQILMDGRNYDMGTEDGTVSNRWISDVQKGKPEKLGETIFITAVITLTMRLAEKIVGDTGVDGVIINTELQHSDDEYTKAGVQVGTITE